MEDGLLYRMLKKDPQRGMEQLMGQYMGLVYTLVKNKLRAPAFCQADVEECTADVFCEFYRDMEKFRPEKGSIKAWLCVIAQHNAIDRLRAKGREPERISLDAIPLELPDRDWEDAALRRELIRAVKSLPEPDSLILIRKYYLGESTKEIAEALGLSVSNVDTRAHRAIGKLRSIIGGEDV